MVDQENLANMEDVDGKRLRKSVVRITVDHRPSIGIALRNRAFQRPQDRRALQPNVLYRSQLLPPSSYPDIPMNSVTTRFVKSVMSKERCPIFCTAWMANGQRLITVSSSGEFTLWNGLTFNFETIMQAHESPIRSMVWSGNNEWMITGDHTGHIKYWQPNLNCVKVFKAHDESLRGLSFSPSDTKFVSCSDDGTLRIWDFIQGQKEKVLRGHGADVRCVQWHPHKSLLISGSRDSQQSIKLWDPRSEESINTLYAHKSPVMDLKWNQNGNWLVSASRDHLMKLFDLRKLDKEILTFRGHKSEVTNVAWHPMHEGLLSSGSFDGAIKFWHADNDREIGTIDEAHNNAVWSLAWHPIGHMLSSASNDHTCKFWSRNRPGDLMDDIYNCKDLPDSHSGVQTKFNGIIQTCIPGFSQEDKVEEAALSNTIPAISGIDMELQRNSTNQTDSYVKQIPDNFMRQWNNSTTSREQIYNVPEYVSQQIEPSVSNEGTADLYERTMAQLFRVPPPPIIPNNSDQYTNNREYEIYDNNSENYPNDHYNQNRNQRASRGNRMQPYRRPNQNFSNRRYRQRQ